MSSLNGQGRAGFDTEGDFAGDFGTPEQEIPDTGIHGVYWESCMTMNDTNLIYAHVFDWPDDGLLNIPELSDIGKAWLLSDPDRSPITTIESGNQITLQVPETAPDSIAIVIVIERN